MPYRKHNRYITNEQFADGTTIDGSRIDNALQEVQDHVNSIPLGDLGSRYTQTQFVLGWAPASRIVANQADTRLPWAQAMNSDDQLATVTGGVAAPPESYQNPQRIKGYATPGIVPTDKEIAPAAPIPGNGAQYIWTTPIHFGKPVILKSLELFFMTDDVTVSINPYANTYQFTTRPEGYPIDATEGVTIQVLADRPKAYGSEDRKNNQIVANKTDFVVVDARMNAVVAAPTVDMFPTPWPGGNMDGKYFQLDMNEPIPQKTRIRIAVCIPDYTNSDAVSTWEVNPSGNAAPWLRQYYSMTLTVLEELER
jgi:hypothetical protein